MRRRGVVLGGCGAVLVACGTSSQSATAGVTPVPAAVGERITSGVWSLTVTGAKRHASVPGTFFSTIKPVGEFVVVGVTAEHTASENVALTGWDYALIDGAGTRYTQAQNTALDGWAKSNGHAMGRLGSGTGPLPPRTPTLWALVFDVTPGAPDLRVRLRSSRTHAEVPLGI